MGLTRIKAQQISDIDYKQAVRVITLTNITLSGGAPSSVDDVNLVADDRVLVAGQSTGSQNGLYRVQTVGAGSNGTWVRTSDGNETGEIEAGMIVMVTEGTSYADTQWKLITNNPIIIGTTALVFEQSSAYSFGTITANAVGIVADTVGDTVTFAAANNLVMIGNAATDTITFEVSQNPTFTSVSSTGNITGGNLDTAGQLVATGNIAGGNITTAGNVTASYFLGNVSQATGIFATKIFNGTSEANITSSGGNLEVSIGGTADIVVISSGGLETSGTLTASGNITGSNILGNGSGLSGINSFGNIAVSGQTNVTADNTSDLLTLVGGTGIDITTDAGNNKVTIAAADTNVIWITGGDMDLVSEAATIFYDFDLVTEAVTTTYDLGGLVTSGIIYPDQLVLPSKTVSELNSISAAPAGQFVFCSNESGGAIPAFSDGTNWRRVSDRAIVT